ncbi:hypothetical protein FE784_23290 [Paenibacillus hemerocallicola]|uniref:Uncharacterized protein n=1 Tax=Paenibacillus hemerocallicola TaxID=1172614 RepID=A0A5C4T3Z6_9BACL|nr:hypothetical protein [Paenibacillus hemerocallicola]TNJ63804.1 hypothetical protein FE784_23290 [Paenibacillus hemerocallicola]
MSSKRCLFCDKVVPIRPKGEYDCYVGCSCAPEGSYNLLRDSYEHFVLLSYQIKRQMFPIISGYIRELTDNEEAVALSVEDIEAIRNSPRIPATVEQKESLMLKYLFRRSDKPFDPVVLGPLADHCNLTYSPSMQELVYIIEKLRDEKLLERIGTTFKLTEKGWSAAKEKSNGKRSKPCFVMIPEQAGIRESWSEKVIPAIERFGYAPHVFEPSKWKKVDDSTIRLISESKLFIADLSGQCPEVYFAGGLALGMEIPVICSVKREYTDALPVMSMQFRPIGWENADELAELMQQRLRA